MRLTTPLALVAALVLTLAAPARVRAQQPDAPITAVQMKKLLAALDMEAGEQATYDRQNAWYMKAYAEWEKKRDAWNDCRNGGGSMQKCGFQPKEPVDSTGLQPSDAPGIDERLPKATGVSWDEYLHFKEWAGFVLGGREGELKRVLRPGEVELLRANRPALEKHRAFLLKA